MNAFAEEAPVYDVDNYPPQFDGQAEVSGSAPKPPPSIIAPGAVPASPDQSYEPSVNTQSMTLDQRVSHLEGQINNALHGELATKVNDVQTQIQALRGQVEELSHQVQLLQAQQKATPAPSAAVLAPVDSDVDEPAPEAKSKSKSKTKAAAGLAASNTATAAVEADSQPNAAEEQKIYQTAYGLIKAKKYNEAAATLQKMLQKYPSGQFAANAHYWLGELYGLLGKNDQSVAEFSTVVKNYPESPKLADSQLKLGLIYSAQLKWSDAKSAFKKVITNYPGTSSARLASEQLKQIKQAGH